MSKQTEIRASIVTLLNKPLKGTFYPKERFTKSQRDMATLYGEQVEGGYIRLVSRKRTKLYEGRDKITLRYQITYLHFFSDEDNSQETFEDNLEAFDDEFMATDELEPITGASHWTDDGAGLSVNDAQPVMFAGVLCHRGLMSLTIEYFE